MGDLQRGSGCCEPLDQGLRRTWYELETDPEDLDMDGFNYWGPVLYEKHRSDDPVALAKKLFPDAGDYFEFLYPGYERQPDQPLKLVK